MKTMIIMKTMTINNELLTKFLAENKLKPVYINPPETASEKNNEKIYLQQGGNMA